MDFLSIKVFKVMFLRKSVRHEIWCFSNVETQSDFRKYLFLRDLFKNKWKHALTTNIFASLEFLVLGQ